jgi:hypothetical protein
MQKIIFIDCKYQDQIITTSDRDHWVQYTYVSCQSQQRENAEGNP